MPIADQRSAQKLLGKGILVLVTQAPEGLKCDRDLFRVTHWSLVSEMNHDDWPLSDNDLSTRRQAFTSASEDSSSIRQNNGTFSGEILFLFYKSFP